MIALLIGLALYGVLATVFLALALGGNEHLVRENRQLRSAWNELRIKQYGRP